MKYTRKDIYEKFNGHCAYCGCEIELSNFQVDHIIPKEFFAQRINEELNIPQFLTHLTRNDCEHYDNKFPSCNSCNHYKNTFDLETFREQLGQLKYRMNMHMHMVQYRIAKRFGMIQEIDKPIIFHFETITH